MTEYLQNPTSVCPAHVNNDQLMTIRVLQPRVTEGAPHSLDRCKSRVGITLGEVTEKVPGTVRSLPVQTNREDIHDSQISRIIISQ
jgi:hypothetical protein